MPKTYPVDLTYNGLRYFGQFTEGATDKPMVVVLRGNCNRELEHPPVFQNWPAALEDLDVPVLRLSDPTLLLSDKLVLGTFTGTESQDATASAIPIVRRLQAVHGLRNRRLVFLGTSGAGFASILAASMEPDACAVAVVPQTKLNLFQRTPFGRVTSETFRPGSNLWSITQQYPARMSAIAAVKAAHDRGLRPRITVLQNLGDQRHYTHHYLPFLQAFAIQGSDGKNADGTIEGVTYNVPDGHYGMPPDALIMERLRHAVSNVPAHSG